MDYTFWPKTQAADPNLTWQLDILYGGYQDYLPAVGPVPITDPLSMSFDFGAAQVDSFSALLRLHYNNNGTQQLTFEIVQRVDSSSPPNFIVNFDLKTVTPSVDAPGASAGYGQSGPQPIDPNYGMVTEGPPSSGRGAPPFTGQPPGGGGSNFKPSLGNNDGNTPWTKKKSMVPLVIGAVAVAAAVVAVTAGNKQ